MDGIDWKQSSRHSISFDAISVTQISQIKVPPDNSIQLGNGHPFVVPSHAKPESIFVRESRVRDKQFTDVGKYYLENEHLKRQESRLLVFPKTKELEEDEALHLEVYYEESSTLHPLQENQRLLVPVGFCVKEYLENLNCKSDSTLAEYRCKIEFPVGFYFTQKTEELAKEFAQKKQIELSNIDVNSTDPEMRSVALVISALSSTKIKRPVVDTKLTFELRQRPETLAANKASASASAPPGRQLDLVTFVCDLSGSTALSAGSEGQSQILSYRHLWQQFPRNEVLMFKIEGDAVKIVAEVDSFRRTVLRGILDTIERCGSKNLRMRGGFHLGTGGKGAPLRDSPAGIYSGQEVYGEAISVGAKIGDLKENKDGLILLSDRFVSRFSIQSGISPAPSWAPNSIGGTPIKLYRIDNLACLENVVSSHDDRDSFPTRLTKQAALLDSRLIVGLDPDLSKFPVALQSRYQGAGPSELSSVLIEFNKVVIEATRSIAVAYKPQSAFYERYGVPGMQALRETIRYLRDNELISILDAKRNDIDHTAAAYAAAWLGKKATELERETIENSWRVDAITVNPYLGKDGIRPFLDADKKAGLFVLGKTSNKSSGDIQDLLLKKTGNTVYERVAELVAQWSEEDEQADQYSRIGLVVGATFAEETSRIRRKAPRALFLMPGIGAQGGSNDAIALGSGKDKLGAYAPISRGIIYDDATYKNAHGNNWAEVVREQSKSKAIAYRDGIRKALG